MSEYSRQSPESENLAVEAATAASDPSNGLLYTSLRFLAKSHLLRNESYANFIPHSRNFIIRSLLSDETFSQYLLHLSFHHPFFVSKLSVVCATESQWTDEDIDG